MVFWIVTASSRPFGDHAGAVRLRASPGEAERPDHSIARPIQLCGRELERGGVVLDDRAKSAPECDVVTALTPAGLVDAEALISAGNWNPSWIGTVEANREDRVRAAVLEPVLEGDLPAVGRVVGGEGAAVDAW